MAFYIKKLKILFLFLQSHISENPDEVKAVENLYPSYKNYTDVYDKNNLLTSKVSCTSRHNLCQIGHVYLSFKVPAVLLRLPGHVCVSQTGGKLRACVCLCVCA